MLGCEFENEYKVYSAKKEGEETVKDQLLFKCNEVSSCCQRHCCCGSVRSFCMDIQLNCGTFDPLAQKHVEQWVPFLRLERDYKCTFFCLNRPYMKVFKVDDKEEELVGYVKHRWSLCRLIFDLVQAKHSDPVYTIDGACCQCGVFFTCPCSPCRNVYFGMTDNRTNSKIGGIVKTWSGCTREMMSDADCYCVTFPLDMSAEFKALVLAAGVMIDYRYFEISPFEHQLRPY